MCCIAKGDHQLAASLLHTSWRLVVSAAVATCYGQLTTAPAVPKLALSRLKSEALVSPSLSRSPTSDEVPNTALRALKSEALSRLSCVVSRSPALRRPIST